MKIGRNDPCTCNSGKKYKKCCLDKQTTTTLPREVLLELERKRLNQQKQKKALKDIGIHVNYVNPIMFQDKKVWALGSRLYHSKRENETFHEFIIEVFKTTLGKEWWEQNIKQQNRHAVMIYFLKFYEWRQKNATEDNKICEDTWSSVPDGWTKSLISLAFDVCSLIHSSKLPDHILNRLKNRHEYQGARYEIAIAAVFARLGCDIEFLDDVENTKKHCEFIATHKESGTSVYVEVKSRHRKGVLHEKGIFIKEKSLKGDVDKLVREALKQKPENEPFLIFVDINSPITEEKGFDKKQWFNDVIKRMGRLKKPTESNPDPFNAIFFTNFAYHYQAEEKSKGGEVLSCLPKYTKFELPNKDFLMMIRTALSNYGAVPNIDFKD